MDIINIAIRNKQLIKDVDTIALEDSKLLYQQIYMRHLMLYYYRILLPNFGFNLTKKTDFSTY